MSFYGYTRFGRPRRGFRPRRKVVRRRRYGGIARPLVGGIATGLAAGALFSFLRRPRRKYYAPVTRPAQVINNYTVQQVEQKREGMVVIDPKVEDKKFISDEEMSAYLEKYLEAKLSNSDNAAEVLLAYGNLDELVDEVNECLKSKVAGKTNYYFQVFSESSYWSSYEKNGETFVFIFTKMPDLNKISNDIEGSPALTLRTHKGNPKDQALVDFLDKNEVAPENIIYYKGE